MTVRAKVADRTLLVSLQTQLTSPGVVAYLTNALSARVAAALNEGPRRREQLEAERSRVQRTLKNLLALVEDGGATPTTLSAIRETEAELERIDRELRLKPAQLQQKLVVLPS